MSTWVVDTSVAAKWFLREPDAMLALRLLSADYRLHAPTLLLLEFDNVMATHVRRGNTQKDEAHEIRDGLKRIPLKLYDTSELREAAFELAVQCRKSIYDCCFLALAQNLGACMITDDRRFLRNLPTSILRWTLPLECLES